jgi:hypothetical protein
MKSIYIVIVLLFMFSCKSAESFLKKSELLRTEAKFDEELLFLKKSFDLKPTVSTGRKIALSYYSLKNYHQAEYWFKWIRSNSKISINDHYILAEILISNGKYSEAKFLLEDLVAIDEMQTSQFKWQNLVRVTYDALNIVPNNPNKVIYSYKEINSPYSDIALFTQKKNIYFLSNRLFYSQGNLPYQNSISIDNTYYRIFELDSLGKTFESGLINSTVKSDQNYHLGPFFLQDSLFVFTFSGYNPQIFKHKESVIKPQILFNKNNEFIKLVTGDSEQYFVSDPFYDSNNNRIYFSSNLPGSIGGLDIFYVVYDSLSMSWSPPVNGGELINTLGDERSPFVFDNSFYFSSNGLGGMGGYDVFISEMNEGVFSRPLNLGIPFNSSGDDLFYFYDSRTQQEYVTSDREGGVGSDDIYRIETKSNLVNNSLFFGMAKKENNVSTKYSTVTVDSLIIFKDLYFKRIPFDKLVSDFENTYGDQFNFTRNSMSNSSIEMDWNSSFQLMVFRNRKNVHLSYDRFNSDVFSLVSEDLKKNSSSKIEIKVYLELKDDRDFRDFVYYIHSEILKNKLDPERFLITRLEDLYLDDLSMLYYCPDMDETVNFISFNLIDSNDLEINQISEGQSYPQLGLFILDYYSGTSRLSNVHHVNEFSGQFGSDVNYYMIVGSFKNLKDAEILRDKLSLKYSKYTFNILPPTPWSKQFRVSVLDSYCPRDILQLFDEIRKELKIQDSWILSI